MRSELDLEKQVFSYLRDYSMSTVLLRNAVSRKLGINITDMECLSLLAIKRISTPTELADYTGMTSGSATIMLDRLERANLIKRKPNPHDRRGVLIEINQQSTAKIASLFAGVQKAQIELINHFSEEELKTLSGFLSSLINNINDQIDSIRK